MNLDTRLQTAVGNGAGLALSPQDVIALLERLRRAENGFRADANSVKTSLAIGCADGSKR
jgi:arginine/ornithine N-succinyltransferase beta subunit